VGDTHSGPTLSSATRRKLMAQSNRLSVKLTVGHNGVTEAVVAQLRQMFEKTELIKIRVEAEKGDDAKLAGEELAQKVPCCFVRHVGKVVVLYKPKPPETEE